MFDANARHIPRGRKFFVDIYYSSDRLKARGINKGDLVYCHMLNESHENPCVDMMVEGNMISVCANSEDDQMEDWLVYAGRPDGTDFICEKTRVRAMAIMEDIKGVL